MPKRVDPGDSELRVAHLTSAHPRSDTRIFVKECASLAHGGMEVSLVVADGLGNETRGRIKIYDVSRPKWGRWSRMTITLVRVLKISLKLKCDVYHFHDPELLPVGLFLHLCGRYVVYDVHEDLPRQIMTKEWITPHLRAGVSKIVEAYENWVSRKFSAIIAATPFITNRFSKFHTNCINVNNYPVLGEFSVTKHWGKKRREVCYIGGIARVRGIVELVEAMTMTKTRLNLAGRYSPLAFSEELKELDGWNKVNYWGFQDRNGIREILAQSMIGIVTLHPIKNYLDSLPVKMFEYMAAGIPIIASNFPYWDEIIRRHQCGLTVDPLRPNDIANAINYLLAHPDEAERMGRNGRNAVLREYNWRLEEEKLLVAYHSIVR